MICTIVFLDSHYQDASNIIRVPYEARTLERTMLAVFVGLLGVSVGIGAGLALETRSTPLGLLGALLWLGVVLIVYSLWGS
jgi:hypothetical protein